jgi:hypothetical protein
MNPIERFALLDVALKLDVVQAVPPTPQRSYQLDLTTPGILPSKANCRKQMRQSWKRRMYPRGRPHNRQRLRTRVGYFLRFSRSIILFLATCPPQSG